MKLTTSISAMIYQKLIKNSAPKYQGTYGDIYRWNIQYSLLLVVCKFCYSTEIINNFWFRLYGFNIEWILKWSPQNHWIRQRISHMHYRKFPTLTLGLSNWWRPCRVISLTKSYPPIKMLMSQEWYYWRSIIQTSCCHMRIHILVSYFVCLLRWYAYFAVD